MKNRCAAVWAAIGLALAGTSAVAADQAYSASGRMQFAPVLAFEYIEVWGVGGVGHGRYAAVAADEGDAYHYLTQTPRDATLLSMGQVPQAAARWSYDPAAAPTSVSNTGSVARYAMGPIEVTLTTLAGLSSTMGTAQTQMNVYVNAGHTVQGIGFFTSQVTGAGPIPGSTFSYSGLPSDAGRVDLKDMLGTAYLSQGFDLSAFQTLPVRLRNPSSFRPVRLELSFDRREPGASYGLEPPSTLLSPDFGASEYPPVIVVYFDGLFDVSVSPLDFATETSYLAARDWVTNNIRQINYESVMLWNIDTITAVPEPASALLGAAGLLLVAGTAARRRKRSGAAA